MTRKSKRELENELEEIEVQEGVGGLEVGEVRTVTQRRGEWIDSFTGELVDVDEDDIIIDFEGVDT